jgi:hypothetical protein
MQAESDQGEFFDAPLQQRQRHIGHATLKHVGQRDSNLHGAVGLVALTGIQQPGPRRLVPFGSPPLTR